jgi:hypothetical protein
MPAAAGRESPAAGDCIAGALAVLKIDLEMHEHRAADIKRLIGQLSTYANGAEPRVPPVANPKHPGGRPPIDPGDERRAKNAEKQRLRRQRIRAAVPPPTPPPSKPKPAKKNSPRHRKSIATAVEAAAAIVPPPAVNGSATAAPPPPDDPSPPPAVAMMSADELRARLADVQNLKQAAELHAAAVALVEAAGKAKDTAAFRQALELKLRSERAGGQLLCAVKKAHVGELGIQNLAQRWREFGRLSDEAFAAKIAGLKYRYPRGVRARRPASGAVGGPVVQTLSDWQKDEAGNLCRSLVTEGEQPRLAGEGHPPPA